ncbi:MAG: hypothetical protein M3O70_18465 [Actinomycetota bacterium]|nr:hypothetical protein [Actinomycetota bacterium]
MSNQPRGTQQTDQNPWVEAQDRYLQTVRESQEAITEALSTWSQSFAQVGPDQGLPINDLYARFEQTIDQMFGFFQQLLDHNREFVRSVVQATRPLADTVSQQAEAAGGRQGSRSQQQGDGPQRQESGSQQASKAGSRQS